jgi:hypothetical protein
MPYAPEGEAIVVHRASNTAQVVVMPTGGGGSQTQHELSYWVWPLPQAGPVRIICDWAWAGIGECAAELSLDHIVNASARAIKLWKDQ